MSAISIHVVVYQEDSWYVAHCLEFDLVAQGDSVVQAFKNLLDAIELQAAYSLETGDLGNLFQPAPAEYWEMLVMAEPYTPELDGGTLPTLISRVDCSLIPR